MWGIGRHAAVDGPVDYPVSGGDFERDVVWARGLLSGWGVGSGDFVAVVSSAHEAPWFGAVVDAVNALEATVCPLEPSAWEVSRTEMLLRRFPIRTVVGLDTVLGGELERSVGLGHLLEGVDALLVRPDTYAAFREMGFECGVIGPLGPALAMSCCAGHTFHVNGDEWSVAPKGSDWSVTTIGSRAHHVDGLAFVGPAASEVRSSCSCGRASCFRLDTDSQPEDAA